MVGERGGKRGWQAWLASVVASVVGEADGPRRSCGEPFRKGLVGACEESGGEPRESWI